MRAKLVYVGVHLLLLALLTGLHLFVTIVVLVLSMSPLSFDMDTPPPPPTALDRLFDILYVLLTFPVVTVARDLAEAPRVRLFYSDFFLLINSYFWASVVYIAGRWIADKVKKQERAGRSGGAARIT
jgi:hypothetical protein